jgi:hypothetical protein
MSAPKPEVLYLPMIFKTIRSGKIRIPAFQRGFVWRESHIIELLESVYKSYPIGSLLFWHVDSNMMRTDDDETLPFPHPPVEGDVDFVLDGMQRISALYGAFHELPPRVPPDKDKFAFVFDLAKQKFLPLRDRNENCVSLRDIFSPVALIKEQGRLSKLKDGSVLMERSIHLQQTFQSYLIPVVSIGDRSTEEVVEIFERVNRMGMRLSAVDFMRALTWSHDFDLTKELAALKDSVELDIPPDTIAKIVALVLNVLPVSNEIVRLRKMGPEELIAATQSARSALIRSSLFLRNDLGVLSYDYIPYEGQFLILASLASSLDDDAFPPPWLASWFWTVGFSESFRGRPNPDVARMALSASRAPNAPIKEHFSLNADDFMSRTHRKGASLSMTTLMALATAPAYSVFSGEQIDATEIMESYDAASTGTVFSRDAIGEVLPTAPRTDLIIGNIILLSRTERRKRRNHEGIQQAILKMAKTPEGKKVLASQCISNKCVTAISVGDCRAFLRARADALFARARALSKASK